MPQWTFVRHGQSRANAEGWFAGTFDSELTLLGQSQAQHVRATLRGQSFERAFASDLHRAYRTAQLLLEGSRVQLRLTPSLRERSCGVLERRSIADVAAEGALDVLSTWSGRPPGGESLRDVALRSIAWLAAQDAGLDTLVVVHGALIRAVIGALDGTPPDDIAAWRPRNCEVVVRDLPVGGWAELRDRL